MTNDEMINDLEEIRVEMTELLAQATRILKHNAPKHIYSRAEAYWLKGISQYLSNDSMGSYTPTFSSTITELDDPGYMEE